MIKIDMLKNFLGWTGVTILAICMFVFAISYQMSRLDRT